MSEQDGGPAFPGEIDNVFVDISGQQKPFTLAARQKGMTLRDYFAGQALIAFAAVAGPVKPSDDAHAGIRCYEIADAMLKARQA